MSGTCQNDMWRWRADGPLFTTSERNAVSRGTERIYDANIPKCRMLGVSCFGTFLGSPFIGYMFLQNEKEKPEKMKMEEISRVARRFWISVQSSGEPKDLSKDR